MRVFTNKPRPHCYSIMARGFSQTPFGKFERICRPRSRGKRKLLNGSVQDVSAAEHGLYEGERIEEKRLAVLGKRPKARWRAARWPEARKSDVRFCRKRALIIQRCRGATDEVGECV